ncbi:hypothetical protein MC885_017591 [Smutsia gigantea]|nr:hypothetical protein MC885_017591 [Smutsia gigantea]
MRRGGKGEGLRGGRAWSKREQAGAGGSKLERAAFTAELGPASPLPFLGPSSRRAEACLKSMLPPHSPPGLAIPAPPA